MKTPQEVLKKTQQEIAKAASVMYGQPHEHTEALYILVKYARQAPELLARAEHAEAEVARLLKELK